MEERIQVTRIRQKIAKETEPFYASLFTENHKFRPSFDNLNMPVLSVMDSITLEKEFTEVEVKQVFDHFGVKKSPGPDGFTMEFYKQAWEIHDGILIASELINSRLRSQETGIICKVDFEKAFDNLNWGCVDTKLARFGFGYKWRSWIKWCITTPRFVVLIKGEANKMFRNQKGINQGDPIFAFLFILVPEVLSLMFKSSANQGLISGFTAEQGPAITQLHFADDFIVFLYDNETQVQNLKNLLIAFETIYGLKVNFKKSTIVGLGQFHNGDACAEIFGCSCTQ
ncbi:uncharacterized protein LOC113304960 [Papaver somniferum]|uniref:uncharacterized protein LOC113304960 n=1 Tax=Papaver somniferum TaxID=3469 RepID=UPI000E6F9519|nr:uncharacterized protein LOC113304960 [Papaver somniferum]